MSEQSERPVPDAPDPPPGGVVRWALPDDEELVGAGQGLLSSITRFDTAELPGQLAALEPDCD